MFGLWKTKKVKKEKIKAVLQALTIMSASDGDIDETEAQLIAGSFELIKDHFDFKGSIEADFMQKEYDLDSLLDYDDKFLLITLLASVLVVDKRADYNEIIIFKSMIFRMGLDPSDFSEMFENIFNAFNVNITVFEEYEAFALKNGPKKADEAFADREKYLSK